MTPNSKTLQDHLKALGGAALIVALILLALELLLRFVDPWGLRYFNDLLVIGNDLFQADSQRDYIIADGDYQLSYWDMSIRNGTRAIPANHADAACTIVLLGDSVIFGYGVDDNETTANYLAERFPDVNFINTGMVAYNSSNILANYRAFPTADAYLYVIVGNDMDAPIATEGDVFISSGNERLPQLVRYVNFAIYRNENKVDLVNDPHTGRENEAGMQRFLGELTELGQDERLHFVTFDFYRTLIHLIEAEGVTVNAISYPPQVISLVDAHLNPEGNQVFADALAPIIETMTKRHCS